MLPSLAQGSPVVAVLDDTIRAEVRRALGDAAEHVEFPDPAVVHRPSEPWELIQVGNCGPPIETGAGWLVLTHGVGPMRVYSIGAILLDLDDPTRLLARTTEPLLTPAHDERDGYVPNVVYSCGGFLHGGTLWIPYGVDDARVAVAAVDLDGLLDSMTRS